MLKYLGTFVYVNTQFLGVKLNLYIKPFEGGESFLWEEKLSVILLLKQSRAEYSRADWSTSTPR